MRTHWQDVLDVQLDIYNALTSEAGQDFGGGWFRGNYRDPVDRAHNQWTSERDAYEDGRRWSFATGVSAFNSEPVFVDDEMMTILEAAVGSFHGEVLMEEDLITRQGLLVLPRSLWLTGGAVSDSFTDHAKYRLNWKVAQWEVHGNVVRVTLFHDQTEPDELDAAWPDRLQRFRWVPTHSVTWLFGEYHPGREDVYGAADAQIQLQAIWRLMNQTLAVKVKERVPGPFRKRALKAKLDREHVTIVRLRRPAAEGQPDVPGEHGPVNWTHRWLVGGHWRNQPYKSLGIHRQIWISPYVKGPEELPLVVNKARIFALVR